MEASVVIAFMAASAVLIVVPGVDMALVTRQAVSHGRRSALATVAGLLTGILTHTALAALGLSAVLATSATAYTVVRYIGAAYLLALGLQILWGTRHSAGFARHFDLNLHDRHCRQAMSARRAYLLGLTSNLTNPKIALFFLTFLPQFVRPGPDVTRQTAALGLVFAVMGAIWLVGFALALGRVADWLERPAVRRRIERLTGAVLIAFGVRLAVQR